MISLSTRVADYLAAHDATHAEAVAARTYCEDSAIEYVVVPLTASVYRPSAAMHARLSTFPASLIQLDYAFTLTVDKKMLRKSRDAD